MISNLPNNNSYFFVLLKINNKNKTKIIFKEIKIILLNPINFI